MLPAIQKLLALQERDVKILRMQEELSHLPVERQQLQAQAASVQKRLEDARFQVNHLESERKKLELEVAAQKQLIEKYSLQQFQTKRNEEYRALTHEIDGCKAAIVKLDDQQLAIMEQVEALQHQVATLTRAADDAKRNVDSRLTALTGREQTLRAELAALEAERDTLATGVDETLRKRYERLLRSKGQNVVVGIERGVCGGCHMQLSRQTVVFCQANQEIQSCTNCGRILYYAEGMDVSLVE